MYKYSCDITSNKAITSYRFYRKIKLQVNIFESKIEKVNINKQNSVVQLVFRQRKKIVILLCITRSELKTKPKNSLGLGPW